MKHTIPHDLGFDLAKRATERAFAGYRERFADFSPEASWVTNDRAEVSFGAKGVPLAGSVVVRPAEIELELEVPLLFRPLRGKAMGVIEGQIQEWIGRAKSGELD